MGLAGDLKEIAFSDVAHLCSRAGHPTKLVVTHPETEETLGVFYFEAGDLVDAKMGDAEGEEALHRALGLQEGRFHAAEESEPCAKRSAGSLSESLRAARAERSGVSVPTDDAAPDPSDERAAEPGSGRRTVVCLTCDKTFLGVDICPDDGTRLVAASGGPLSVRPLELAASWPPSPALPRPRGSRRLTRTLALSGLVAAMLGLAALLGWALRAGRLRSSVGTRDTALQPRQGPSHEATTHVPVGVSSPVNATSPSRRTAGITETEVIFGLVAPFSGPARSVGEQMKTGVEAAFAEANAKGGVAGRKLRLEVRDDGFEPARTLGALRELDQSANVLGVLGNAGTANAVFATPFAADRRMLFFGPPSGSPMLRHVPPERYAFNVRASTADEILAVARHLTEVRHLPARQIAVVSLPGVRESSDAALLGELRLTPLLERAPFLRLGRPTHAVLDEATQRSIDTDAEMAAAVRDAVVRLTTHVPPLRAALVVAPAPAAAQIVALAKEKRPAMIFAVISPVGATTASEELRHLPPRLTRGTLVTHVVPSPEGASLGANHYRAALAQSVPGEAPRELSFEAYVTAQILVHGLARAGRTLDSERLVEALEELRGTDLGLEADLGFSSRDHQAWHRVWATEVGANGVEAPVPLAD